MIHTVNRKIKMNKELRSKIEWACSFVNKAPKNGNLRIIEHTNLAYVEPHIVSIENINYLFFNEHEYFYIGNLNNKHPISKFREIIGS